MDIVLKYNCRRMTSLHRLHKCLDFSHFYDRFPIVSVTFAKDEI